MTPLEAMQLAIEEGRKGSGFVSPNPLVGCVILDREFRFLSKGFHARVGEAHAEVNALGAVADPQKLEGAHVFVTLEPCAHQGRTPSCANHLAGLPIASVTYGLEDPNPLVSGKGAERLRQAGKKVELFSELKDELEELGEIFLTGIREARPFVALKVAASLDGRIALANGESRWITGEAAREHVQYLRGCYDAVLVGVGTFLADDPRLNSRDPRFASKIQRAVILDPEGRSFEKLSNSALLQVRRPEDVFVVTKPVTKRRPAADAGVNVLEVPDFDLPSILTELRARGVHSLFVEGGGATYAGLLNSRLADRLYLFTAPKILGEGLSWTSGLKIPSLSEAIQLRQPRYQMFGEDQLLTARLSGALS